MPSRELAASHYASTGASRPLTDLSRSCRQDRCAAALLSSHIAVLLQHDLGYHSFSPDWENCCRDLRLPYSSSSLKAKALDLDVSGGGNGVGGRQPGSCGPQHAGRHKAAAERSRCCAALYANESVMNGWSCHGYCRSVVDRSDLRGRRMQACSTVYLLQARSGATSAS